MQAELKLRTDPSGHCTLDEARKIIPGCPTRKTLMEWAECGINGVKLRTIRPGRRHFTRPEWVVEFLEECERVRAVKRRVKRLRIRSHADAMARCMGGVR